MEKEKTVIYWFSGTGNSLAVAKELAAQLPDTTLVAMSEDAPKEVPDVDAAKIGFVFPVYYGKPPRLVEKFIADANFDKTKYYFAVVTYGGVGAGAVTVLSEQLRKKGVELSYGNAVRMSGNYILRYNPPLLKEKALKKVSKQVRAFTDDIRKNAKSNPRRLVFATEMLSKNIESLDDAFFVDENCTGCGICAKVCPVKNIEIARGRPAWQHHCEHCVRCISWCPAAAIQYGNKTAKRRRHRHPDVRLNDILAEDFTVNE